MLALVDRGSFPRVREHMYGLIFYLIPLGTLIPRRPDPFKLTRMLFADGYIQSKNCSKYFLRDLVPNWVYGKLTMNNIFGLLRPALFLKPGLSFWSFVYSPKFPWVGIGA